MTRSCIGSFVFFDLETTGLPDLEFAKTKITEICLIACSREHILGTEKNELPRVLSKLSFCVNPLKVISTASTQITGLDNILLENVNKFDGNSVKLLNHFLLQLPQPVCLVAHNGERFDFPIIQKQLKMLESTLPDDLCCIDSLAFFRSLEDKSQSEQSDLPRPLIPDSCLEKVFMEPVLPEKGEAINVIEDNSAPCQHSTIDSVQPTDDFEEKDVHIALLNEDVKKKQELNEATPGNRKTVAKQNLFRKKCVVAERSSITPPSKRALFSVPPALNPSKRMKFTLTAVHERLLGIEPIQSHYAEADTLALLRCVIASKKEFIEYAQENAKLFKDIRPMG